VGVIRWGWRWWGERNEVTFGNVGAEVEGCPQIANKPSTSERKASEKWGKINVCHAKEENFTEEVRSS